MSPKIGLIIGVGSIGRRHAEVMSRRYSRLFVVDFNSKARQWASEQFQTQVMCAASLDEIADLVRVEASDVTAVIATWGPTHFSSYTQLVDLGVKRVFCEKPLATSLRQLRVMRDLCRQHEVALTAGLHFRYRGMAEFIRRVAGEHLGGVPSTFVVDGGARCIATTGSHWLDLAIVVFGATPSAVVASLSSDSVNPRSPELRYWDGTASWEFPGGQRVTLTFDNSSSVHEQARFYSPTGVLEIDPSLAIRAYGRDRAELAADDRVTRVGEVMRNQSIAEFIPDTNSVLSLQLDELEGLRAPSYAVDAVVDSATALVAAFESSRLERRLVLPPSSEITENSLEWNIS